MKKVIINCCFLMIGIGIANAQYFKTEDFEIQENGNVIQQEQRVMHFPPGKYTKAQEDSLRALFSEENFKKKPVEEPTKKMPDAGFLNMQKNRINWDFTKEEV